MDTFTINKFVNAEFSSPFEEFKLALDLNRCGIKTVHPRAICRAGEMNEANTHRADRRR